MYLIQHAFTEHLLCVKSLISVCLISQEAHSLVGKKANKYKTINAIQEKQYTLLKKH